MPTTAPRDWAPRPRRYTGRVFRYVPHFAAERDPERTGVDGSHAQEEGGRWNPPRSFPVLYTSCTETVAIANLRRKYQNAPFQPWELDEADQADLYTLEVDQPNLADALSADGLAGIGLPDTYPDNITYEITQPVGARLHREDYAGVRCRSAADRTGEEIALFIDENHAVIPSVVGAPRQLPDWFPVPED